MKAAQILRKTNEKPYTRAQNMTTVIATKTLSANRKHIINLYYILLKCRKQNQKLYNVADMDALRS